MKYVLRVFSEKKKKKFANRKLDLWSVLLTVYREGLLLDLTLRVRRTGLDWTPTGDKVWLVHTSLLLNNYKRQASRWRKGPELLNLTASCWSPAQAARERFDFLILNDRA
jgi:hypothetical protein